MISRVDPVHELRVREIMAELPDTDPDKPNDKWFRDCVECLERIEQIFDNKPWRRRR